MLRKLLLVLLPLFIFFTLSAKPVMAAEVQCGIGPDSVLDNEATKPFVISSGGDQASNRNGNLSGNTAVDIYIGDAGGMGFDCATGAHSEFCYYTDKSGAIKTDQWGFISFTASFGRPLHSGQDLNVYVLPHGSNVGNKLCTVIPIKIIASTVGGGFCSPLNFTPASPKTSDPILLHPTINTANPAPGFGPNDQHNIYMNGSKLATAITSQLEGYVIPAQNTGNYRIEIKNVPLFDNPLDSGTTQCYTTIYINQTGGGIVYPSGSTACPYCPTGSTYNSSTLKCVKADGTIIDPLNDAPCGPQTVCIPGHTEGDEIINRVSVHVKSLCAILGASAYYTGIDQTRRDVCPVALVNGTCPTIPSGFGIPLPTDIGGLINALLGIFLSISGGIAIILIIISGYRVMTSQGNPEKLQAAKEQLTAAIVGVLFVIFSLVILEVVGVDILNIFK